MQNANDYPMHEHSRNAGNAIAVKQSGYVYIYTSNESSLSVYFDNLKVKHHRGALLEETHYYPFGLTMAGISSKAVNTLQNKENTFQGQRFDDELGLDWVQFKWRNHDPQIGRFVEVDPLSEKYVHNSTYSFSENKVTSHIELEGLEALKLAQTDIYSVSAGVAGGLNWGVNYSIKAGTAYDKIGKTQFATATAMNPKDVDISDSNNPNTVTGGSVGFSVGYTGVGEPTFAEAMNSLNVSISIGADFKFGVGGGVNISENSFGLDFGVGLGGTLSATNQESLLYSISISNDEKGKTNLGGNLMVTNSQAVFDASGIIQGFKGEIIEFNFNSINPFAPAVNATGITVFSGVTKDKNQNAISNNQWKSDAYIKREREVKRP